MHQPEDILLAALAAAPRRYRMPPLPADADATLAMGAETSLVFAVEAARIGKERGSPPPADMLDLFTRSLAQLIGDALARDPAFQALLLRTQDAHVNEYVRLSGQRAADRRAVRTWTDAIAHPGKLHKLPPSDMREALSRLHRLAAADSWPELGQAIEQLLGQPFADDEQLRAALAAIHSSPAFERLARGGALLRLESVQRYQSLGEQHGPLAGSDTAAAQGRASAHLGETAERATVEALHRIADLQNRREPGPGGYRVVRGLLTPRGFPGEVAKAKEEWDAAIVRSADTNGAVDIALLAEVKSSPAAATPDFSRLHRGLQRLAHASTTRSYTFASADGDVEVAGESLCRLEPHGRSLPPHVIYCCSAPAEARAQVLSAASKSVLLAERASLAFADRLAQDESPPHSDLAPVWEALTTAPRLRSVLHQWETAQAVREAMLHPEDLLAAVERCLTFLNTAR